MLQPSCAFLLTCPIEDLEGREIILFALYVYMIFPLFSVPTVKQIAFDIPKKGLLRLTPPPKKKKNGVCFVLKDVCQNR